MKFLDVSISEKTDVMDQGLSPLWKKGQDFLGESQQGVGGLIDDVWLTFTVLAELLDQVEVGQLERHWRSDAPFEEVVGLAQDVGSLDDQVPWRVLHRLRTYLGLNEA